MGDLKDIKRWGKKARPHIFALEPRTLFDGEPINSVPEPQSINHDMPSLIVGVSVHDPDDNLSSTQLSVLHGAVTVDISAGAFISHGSNGSKTFTLTGSEAEINTALATLSYTGDSKYVGEDTLTLVSTDSLGNRDEDTVDINVINNAPEVDLDANLETETNEDESVEDYLPQATDVENDAIVYAITRQPTYGSVLIIDDGTHRFRYTPNLVGEDKPNNFYGLDTFEFTVSDGVDSSTYTFNIDILPVNDAPEQTPPLATLNNYYEDTPIEINASDLLVGFTDVDLLDTLSVTDVTVEYGFTWELKDGVYTITAPTDFNGTFDFSYYVTDGLERVAVNRIINVLAVNDTPVRTIGMYEPISLLEGSANNTAVSLGLDGFRYEGGNGDDEKEQELTYQIVTIPDFLKLYKNDGITEVMELEAITLEELRELKYKTVENKNGSGLIEWAVQDDDIENPETLRESLSITVTPINDAPTAADVSVITNEDTAIINGTLPSYTDEEGDAVTYAKASDPSNGSVSINSNGTYTYTPNANFNGTDSFEYSINDGNGGTNSYTVTVDVAAVNDSPIASTATIETDEDIAFSGVLPFATDEEGDAITYSMASDAIKGSVHINSDGSFTYTPDDNLIGTDSFEYRVTDGNGDSSTYRINVDITSVNDAPIGGDKTLTINEDEPYKLIRGDFGFTDADGDTFSGVKITSLPLNGTLTLNEVAVEADDFISIENIDANKLVFTPFLNEEGIAYASFTFKVADHSGAINNLDIISRTITFDVTAVNDAPTSDNASASTLEDVPYTIQTSDFTFDDDEGDNLQAVKITSLPTNGTLLFNDVPVTADTVISIGDIALGQLVFRPTANENGVAYAVFTFQLQDDGGTDNDGINLSPEKTFTINVTTVNDAAPELTGTQATLIDGTEDTSYNISATDLLQGYTDVDLDTLSILDLDAGIGFTIDDNGDGTYTIHPPANYNGPVNLTYKVYDGTASTDATQTFTLAAVNDAAPELTGTQATLIDGTEDTSYNISATDLLQGYTDVDLDTLSILDLDAGIGFTIDDNGDGTYTINPPANYNGPVNLTYKVSDGTASTDATQTFTLAAVNDAPQLTGEKATLADGTEGVSYTITRAQLLGGYIDADLDTLSIVDLDAGIGFTIDDNGDGTFTINPPLNYNGPVNLTYKVSDGTASTDATQTFTLKAANDGPVGTDKSGLTIISRTNTLNDGFELNRKIDASTKEAYQSQEDSEVLNKLNVRQAGLSNVKLADIDELFFVGTSRGLAREPSAEANKDVSLQDSVAAIKDKIFRNAETPPGPITDSQGRMMYKLPASVFKGGQGVIKLGASAKDGSPLPDWIKFDSKTGQFTAEVPKDMKAPLEIKVEAIDARGHKAETTLKILPRPNKASLEGKQSLSTQFNSAFTPAR